MPENNAEYIKQILDDLVKRLTGEEVETVTEIPEHLRKRAEEARKKAEGPEEPTPAEKLDKAKMDKARAARDKIKEISNSEEKETLSEQLKQSLMAGQVDEALINALSESALKVLDFPSQMWYQYAQKLIKFGWPEDVAWEICAEFLSKDIDIILEASARNINDR